jgi:hypothetical protein
VLPRTQRPVSGLLRPAQRLLAGADEALILELLGHLSCFFVHALRIVEIAALKGDIASVVKGSPVSVVKCDRADDTEQENGDGASGDFRRS